jgi:hypothetical protein
MTKIAYSWGMHIEATSMRETPKVKILVWVMLRHNIMDIGAKWNQ